LSFGIIHKNAVYFGLYIVRTCFVNLLKMNIKGQLMRTNYIIGCFDVSIWLRGMYLG